MKNRLILSGALVLALTALTWAQANQRSNRPAAAPQPTQAPKPAPEPKKPVKPTGVVIGLDGWHNMEMPPHYKWEAKVMGGFSQFGEMLQGLGAEITTVKTALTPEALKKISILMIVRPDIPKFNPKPNYIQEPEIKAIVEWVKQGGVLVMMANNEGLCEFERFNKLAKEFGMQFEGNTAKATQTFEVPSDERFFKEVKKLHIVNLTSMKVNPPARERLKLNDQVLMATARLEKGFVWAFGDPWLYNEYINHADNKKCATNIFSSLFGRATPVTEKKADKDALKIEKKEDKAK